jgi:hypothetical protein
MNCPRKTLWREKVPKGGKPWRLCRGCGMCLRLDRYTATEGSQPFALFAECNPWEVTGELCECTFLAERATGLSSCGLRPVRCRLLRPSHYSPFSHNSAAYWEYCALCEWHHAVRRQFAGLLAYLLTSILSSP